MPQSRENAPLPRETSQGLPVVTATTIEAITQNYTYTERWGDHLQGVKARLIEENPHLGRFIESQVGKYPTQLHLPLFEVVIATIAVLEHQASANKLEAQFGDPNDK